MALKAWANGSSAAHSAAERAGAPVRFVSFFQEQVAQELRQVPAGALDGAWQPVLQSQFQNGKAEHRAVSALYFAYFHPLARLRRVTELADSIPVSTRQFQRYLNQGYAWLAVQLTQAEQTANEKRRASLRRFIPEPEYKTLFGVSDLAQKAVGLLGLGALDGGTGMLSLEGLGGIGKTAIAHEVALASLENDRLAGICWVSARQEWINALGELKALVPASRTTHDLLTRLAEQLGIRAVEMNERMDALRSVLSAAVYLVVVDNLETVEDPQFLLPVLASIRGESRILLTSRHSLAHFPYVQTIPVPELSLENSQGLLKDELQRLAAGGITDDQIREIYQLIGGLPLALKLVAAQLAVLPYQLVLDGLRSADRHTQDTLYTYIYQRSWALLSQPARQLLVSMVDADPDGETIDWLGLMCGLQGGDFEHALQQLMNLRLMEKTGAFDHPLYQIHRITASFLSTNLRSKWEAG